MAQNSTGTNVYFSEKIAFGWCAEVAPAHNPSIEAAGSGGSRPMSYKVKNVSEDREGSNLFPM